METATLIPVRSFRTGKRRLAAHIADADREALARRVADRVLAAAGAEHTFIACDDDDVAAWATARHAEVLWGPGLGLNGAIDHGVATIAGKGYDHVTIAHADIAAPTTLPRCARPHVIVIVPDRHRDGTNVVSRPCSVALAATYGPGSFQRHLAAAITTGQPVAVVGDTRLAIDIDTIEDCRHPLVVPILRELGIITGSRESAR